MVVKPSKGKVIVLAAACLILLGVAGRASATVIQLTGTIRDFHMFTVPGGHPDFENGLGDDRGIVLPDLGADGKPVYASATNTWTTHGAALFNQWYNDTPGVNLSIPYAISLANSVAQPDIYTYDNADFFPIDDQLFGNEGLWHNFSFTFELDTQFTYQGTEFFNFVGDDDVFVYINDKLAVDLGGVHGAEGAFVDLTDPATVAALNLTIGQTYDMHLFTAERRTTQSDVMIQTSLVLANVNPDPAPAPAAVPEPATMTSGLLALAGVALAAHRRRARNG
jgi:fibro-slime domain-containing protein